MPCAEALYRVLSDAVDEKPSDGEVARIEKIEALRKDMDATKVSKNDFDESLKKVMPSVTKEIEKSYQDLRKTFTSARAKQMKDEKPAYFG